MFHCNVVSQGAKESITHFLYHFLLVPSCCWIRTPDLRMRRRVLYHCARRYDTQYNNTQHNNTQTKELIYDTQHNNSQHDTEHKELIYNTQHKNTQHNDTEHKGLIYNTQHTGHSVQMTVSITTLNNAECQG